ncbi:ImpL2 [Drosophila busckii]|uniref:ImpL2 n=1 Tax=Drosophila busckii TaxID=30019 RepID=A0A0M5IYQ6_DROBS|nr:neural/ectodermal development factor IMP-L2 [Drosophila busckii]ALC44018.1 ImpL2 [Drosophila busckii]
MNLHLCAIALLLFGSLAGTHGRPTSDDILDDNNAVDNSIQVDETTETKQKASIFPDDWLKFTKTPPAKLHQAPGATVEIVCEVMGSQVPTIQWLVNHFPSDELKDQESNIITVDAPSAIVRVRSVYVIDHMLSTSRAYTCVGRTGSKTIYATTVVHPSHSAQGLIATDKQYETPQKPRITLTEKTHLDLVGSDVMLPCRVHSVPRARITWRNNEDKEIVPSNRYKLLPTGELLISNIKWEDMGNYKCTAQNPIGRDTAETFLYPVLKEQD